MKQISVTPEIWQFWKLPVLKYNPLIWDFNDNTVIMHNIDSFLNDIIMFANNPYTNMYPF